MKTLYVIITLFFVSVNSFGQTITIPEDSIKTLLSHKWGIERITMAGQDVNTSGETVTYDFNKDGTFIRVIEKKTENGTWSYEADKKWVHLKIPKKTNIYILALKEGQFQLTANGNKEPAPDNAFAIIAYFKTIAQ